MGGVFFGIFVSDEWKDQAKRSLCLLAAWEVPKNSQLVEGSPTTPLFFGRKFLVVSRGKGCHDSFQGKGQVKPHIFKKKYVASSPSL